MDDDSCCYPWMNSIARWASLVIRYFPLAPSVFFIYGCLTMTGWKFYNCRRARIMLTKHVIFYLGHLQKWKNQMIKFERRRIPNSIPTSVDVGVPRPVASAECIVGGIGRFNIELKRTRRTSRKSISVLRRGADMDQWDVPYQYCT